MTKAETALHMLPVLRSTELCRRPLCIEGSQCSAGNQTKYPEAYHKFWKPNCFWMAKQMVQGVIGVTSCLCSLCQSVHSPEKIGYSEEWKWENLRSL